MINDLAKVIAALNFIFNFAKDLPDLVFDRVRSSRALFETMQIGEKLLINEVAEVVAGEGFVMIQLALSILRRSPTVPSIRLLNDEAVFLAVEFGLCRAVLL